MAEKPFVPFPNAAELVMHYQVNSTPFSNTFGFLKTSPWSTGALTTMLGLIDDAWTELMTDLFTDECFLVKASAYALDSTEAPSAEIAYTPPLQGTGSGTPTTLNVAMTVKRRAEGRGHGFRGRIFHYGLQVASLADANNWISSVASNVAAKYENFSDTLADGSESTAVLLSRQVGGVWLSEGIARPIIEWAPATKVATRRKRLANVG